MSNLKMNCGYCGRKCSLDKDFCIPQDSVYICKSCYDWKQKVDDLEAKLAEKDQAIESLQEINQSLGQTCNNDAKEIERLREQLANTDKLIAEKKKRTAIRTIEILKSVSSKTYENASDGSEHIVAWLFTPMEVKETLEFINREKFEFKTENQTAIAELEKVKEKVLQETNRVEEIYSDGLQSGFNCCYVFTREIINQQINDLRSK